MKSAKKTCLPVFDKNGHFLLATCNRSMVEGGPRKYSLLVPIILSGAITVMMATLFFLGPMVFGIIHDWWVLRDSPGEVQATVTEWVRDKHPPDKRYRYLVKYRFEKDGASFQGESNVSRRERYKAGDQLKVLYSKDDPAINAKAGTLRPWFGFIMAAVMLFFCAVVVGFLLIVRETLKARKIILSGQFIPAKVDKAELFEGHKKQQYLRVEYTFESPKTGRSLSGKNEVRRADLQPSELASAGTPGWVAYLDDDNFLYL